MTMQRSTPSPTPSRPRNATLDSVTNASDATLDSVTDSVTTATTPPPTARRDPKRSMSVDGSTHESAHLPLPARFATASGSHACPSRPSRRTSHAHERRRLRLLDVAAAAYLLGTPPRFVRRLIAERRIRFYKLGRYVRHRPDRRRVRSSPRAASRPRSSAPARAAPDTGLAPHYDQARVRLRAQAARRAAGRPATWPRTAPRARHPPPSPPGSTPSATSRAWPPTCGVDCGATRSNPDMPTLRDYAEVWLAQRTVRGTTARAAHPRHLPAQPRRLDRPDPRRRPADRHQPRASCDGGTSRDVAAPARPQPARPTPCCEPSSTPPSPTNSSIATRARSAAPGSPTPPNARCCPSRDAERLAAAMPSNLQPLVHLAYWAHGRLGELLALRVGDVNLDRGTLRIERQVIEVDHVGTRVTAPKVGSRRTVHLPEPALDTLRDLLAARPRRPRRAPVHPAGRHRAACASRARRLGQGTQPPRVWTASTSTTCATPA